MRTHEVEVPGTASAPALRASVAVPSGPGPHPGVVVLHEVFGLTDDVRRIARRFAAAGHLAVAPDLYTAGGGLRCVQGVLRALARGAGPAVDDVVAVRDWLAGREDCTGRVGVAGFCLGGGFALLLSGSFGASAPFYGPLPRDLDRVLGGACPVVASYGARDLGLRGAAARLEGALERAGVEHDVREYPGAGHSFMSVHHAGPLTPALRVLERVTGFAHDPAVAEDAWQRTLGFFDRHLRD